MKNRSFKFKITSSLFVFMIALGVGLPVLVHAIKGMIVENYEEKSLEEQGQVFVSYLQGYMDELAGRSVAWLSTSAVEPLNEDPVDVESFENRLLGLGNGVSSSHGVTRIQVWNLDQAMVLDYSTQKASDKFVQNKNVVSEVVKKVIEAEGRVFDQVVADSGQPYMILGVPSEDDDEEVNFVHLYFVGLSPLLERFAKVNGYPTSMRVEGVTVYAASNKELVSEFEGQKEDVFGHQNKTWRKRQISLKSDLLRYPTSIGVYVDVTKLEAAFAQVNFWTNFILAATCVLFFTAFFGLISYLMKPLGSIVSTLSRVSSGVKEKSRTMAKSTEVAMRNVDDQLGAVTSTVTASDEINAMLHKTRELGSQTRTLSEQSRESAESGLKSVEQMVSGVNRMEVANTEMFNTVLEGNSKIAELTQIVERIGEKTEIINTITFQTKLLSFNASVEAARAGEHGKGFAVVAEEVGNLARMSADAAKEINEIVGKSISKVNDTLNSIEEKSQVMIQKSKTEIDTVASVGKECSSGLQKVVENFKQVDSRISDLSLAIDEQTEAVKSISEAMQDIQETAESNQASSRANNQAANELEGESNEITSSVANLNHMFLGHQDASEKKPGRVLPFVGKTKQKKAS